MGNQGSTQLTPHPGLSKKDLDKLKSCFPSPDPASLGTSWTQILDEQAVTDLSSNLRGPNGKEISFQSYQHLAGEVTCNGVEGVAKFLVMVTGGIEISVGSLVTGVEMVVRGVSRIQNGEVCEDCKLLAQSLLHDLIHLEKVRRKVTFSRVISEEESMREVDLGDIEKIVMEQPLLEQLVKTLVCHCLQLDRAPALLMPQMDGGVTNLSKSQIMFLNSHLPHEMRSVWRPLFNSNTDGESFAKLTGSIVNKGPSLVIVWDNKGNIFGGFATDSWRLGPKFYGGSDCLLFHLSPKMNVYETTPYNQNYQYFNLKQKTMPNGLGMGGQLEYFGLWLDSEFGLVKTSPTCSTFHSTGLGEVEGKITHLEVIGVGELSKSDEDSGPSVLDLDPEAQAVLEMMGKTFHGKVIRDVDNEEERKRKIKEDHHEEEG